jgi:hypothetical protein
MGVDGSGWEWMGVDGTERGLNGDSRHGLHGLVMESLRCYSQGSLALNPDLFYPSCRLPVYMGQVPGAGVLYTFALSHSHHSLSSCCMYDYYERVICLMSHSNRTYSTVVVKIFSL